MSRVIAAPHSMPPHLEAVMEAAHEASALGLLNPEARTIFILDHLWEHGWAIASRRRLLAKKIAIFFTVAVISGHVARGLVDHQPHELVWGAAMWFLGLAAGAQVIAWLHPGRE